jgi:hypothetical protein
MLKYFVDKDTNQSIAVNPNAVKIVRDSPVGAKIVLNDGSYVIVTDSYLEVVARLNEKNK